MGPMVWRELGERAQPLVGGISLAFAAPVPALVPEEGLTRKH